jgi:hypothetical protein
VHSRYSYVSLAFLLDAFVQDEAANFGCWRIYSAETEDVEEDEAAVVDEMLDSLSGEG